MNSVKKTTITIINEIKEQGNTRLEVKIKGPDINYIIINTIRRACLSYVPIYAFNEFTFDKNTSIFHNNYLKARIRQLPVWGIENKIDFVEYNIKSTEEYIPDILEEDNDENDADPNVEKILDTTQLKQLTMYVSAKNNTQNIIWITTEHAKFYYNEKQIKTPYKMPIPIVKLQSDQEIIFSAVTKVSIADEHAMYSATSIACYKQITESEFDFIIESRGQISEKRIIYIAIFNIEKKLNNFLNLFIEEIKKNKTDDITPQYPLIDDKSTGINHTNDGTEGVIIISNEDHTLGNIITRGLQLHPKIEFAGYNLPHPLDMKVHFHYKTTKDGNIKHIIKDVIIYYQKLFSEIRAQFKD
jgi:DNA-directed RNA polymerase subunit L/DNA-directed RNA polymerase alpha subunit